LSEAELDGIDTLSVGDGDGEDDISCARVCQRRRNIWWLSVFCICFDV